MQLGLIPRFRDGDVQSPQYRGKLVEFGETVFAHLPEVGKRSGNPAPKLADRWKSGVWLGKSDLTDEHIVRTDNGVDFMREVYDDSHRTAGRERTSSQSS